MKRNNIDANKFIDNYLAWLKTEIRVASVKDWLEISTPFLDRHNDFLQIYVKKIGDDFFLTDDGYVINDLRSSGVELNTPKRKHLLDICLRGFGVTNDNDNLIMRANIENVALKKHNLIQAMISVNDLFYTSRPHVESLFFEDVTNWLDENNVRYSSNLKLAGKSGFDHMYDFVIPKSKNAPERLIQLVNKPSKDSVQAVMFSCMDTIDIRDAGTQMYAFINNVNDKKAKIISSPLRNYDIQPVLWDERETYLKDLAA